MDSKKYVLGHNYGFYSDGYKLLKLRNFEDLKEYINDVISTQFVATQKNGSICFKNGKRVNICVEKI